jgi:phosphoribosylformylglycinamidine synthase PurS subunit
MPLYEVIISLKEGVVDPEGENTRKALQMLGFKGVRYVASSKRFLIDIENGKADAEIEEMCRKLLANPAIQNYSYRRLEGH